MKLSGFRQQQRQPMQALRSAWHAVRQQCIAPLAMRSGLLQCWTLEMSCLSTTSPGSCKPPAAAILGSQPQHLNVQNSAPCAGALQPRHLLLLQVGGDAVLKALSAAEYNAPDAEASAPVLQGFITVIR